jgi:hypothetical protein
MTSPAEMAILRKGRVAAFADDFDGCNSGGLK